MILKTIVPKSKVDQQIDLRLLSGDLNGEIGEDGTRCLLFTFN
jgi:hypothetical protein